MQESRTAHLLLAVFLVVVSGSALWAAEPESDLLPIPEIEMAGVQEDVRAVVQTARVRIDEIAAEPEATTQQLAFAYGELGRAGISYTFLELPEVCFTNAETLDPDQFKWPYYLGVFYQDQRQLDKSVDKLQRALNLKPGNSPATLHLAQVELMRGELKKAERLFESLTSADGWSTAALYGLGRVAAERGEFEKAAELLEKALSSQPDAREIQQQLGLAYRELGRMDQARDLLSRESKTRMTYVDPLIASLENDFSKGSVYLGLVATSRGQHTEAAKHYREAVKSDPLNPVYHQALAQSLSKTGDLTEAIEEHQEAVRLIPEDAMAHVLLAVTIAMRDGNTDEVIRLYQRAVDLSPTLFEAQSGLGNAHYGREQWNRAVDASRSKRRSGSTSASGGGEGSG
jgi:tetratricopeptide (TPR) repeat protein